MYKIDFAHPISIYFIGIGGISMSGLAEVLHQAGFRVAGSDWNESNITKHLVDKGISVKYGESASHITDDIDVAVLTSAVHEDNKEFMEIKRRGIPYISRAELLGQMMKNYDMPIAISGTHGKTTTTSMASEILLAANTDPTLSIGGILKTIGGNIRIGQSEYFVTEACEYTNSFLSFFPRVSIILNVDADHLDFFKDLDDIRASFHKFALLTPENGALIINGDIPSYEELCKDTSCKVITFGCGEHNDYRINNITYDESGNSTFCVSDAAHGNDTFHLIVPGEHNIQNAVACIALSDFLGVSREVTKKGLTNFSGTDRRFEYKGEVNGITIIDDYAHHPTEITACLTAAKTFPNENVWCVFQPHTYSRTKALLKEFAQALSLADKVVLADIYPARETDTLGISSENLLEEIKKLGCECYFFPTFEEIEKFLLKNCLNGDMLITMGAGDVLKIGENLLKK